MPIPGDAFDRGAADRETGTDEEQDAGDGPIETEKRLITSFLSERHDRAFTRREIVLGVDFSPAVETYGDHEGVLGTLVGTLTDGAGDAVASAIVVDDVQEALDELEEDGTIESKEVDVDGETTTFYRLA